MTLQKTFAAMVLIGIMSSLASAQPAPLPPLRPPRLVGRDELRPAERPALVELRLQRVQGVQLLLNHRVDAHHDVGLEGIRLLEVVGVEEEDGVVLQGRHVGAEVRHGHHERRVLNQNCGVAMVGMGIVGPG